MNSPNNANFILGISTDLETPKISYIGKVNDLNTISDLVEININIVDPPSKEDVTKLRENIQKIQNNNQFFQTSMDKYSSVPSDNMILYNLETPTEEVAQQQQQATKEVANPNNNTVYDVTVEDVDDEEQKEELNNNQSSNNNQLLLMPPTEEETPAADTAATEAETEGEFSTYDVTVEDVDKEPDQSTKTEPEELKYSQSSPLLLMPSEPAAPPEEGQFQSPAAVNADDITLENVETTTSPKEDTTQFAAIPTEAEKQAQQAITPTTTSAEGQLQPPPAEGQQQQAGQTAQTGQTGKGKKTKRNKNKHRKTKRRRTKRRRTKRTK